MTKGVKVTIARAKQQARHARQAIKIRESKPQKLTLKQCKTHAKNIFTSRNEDPTLTHIYEEIQNVKKTLLENLLVETEDDLKNHYDDYFKTPLKTLFDEIVSYLNDIHPDYNITNTAFETEEEWKGRYLGDENPGAFLRLSLASYSGSYICDTSRPDIVDDKMYFANTFENCAYGKNRIVLDITPTIRKDPNFDVRKLEIVPPLSIIRNPASIFALTSKDGVGHLFGFSITQKEVVQTTVFVIRKEDMIAGYIVLKLSNLKEDVYDL